MKVTMAMAIRVFLLLLVSFYSIPSFAIYEDQVGLMDWHQQYIGKVKQAVFHTQKAGRKRVVVSTEENAIASLDLRRGDIFWRHVLGSGDVIDELDIGFGKYVFSLSTGGSILRAWNLPDGQMVWESYLQGSVSSKSILCIPSSLKYGKDNIILVFGMGSLHAVSSIDGEVIWRKDLVAESLEIKQVLQPHGSDVVYAIGFVGSEFVTYEINARSGEVLKRTSKTFPGGFSGELSYVSNDMLVALDTTGSTIISIRFGDGQISFHQTAISDLIENFSGMASIFPSKLTSMVALKFNSVIVFVRVTGFGELEVVEKIDSPAAISDPLSVSEGQQAFAVVQNGESKISITVKQANDWSSGNLLKETIVMDQQRGNVEKVFINSYIRTDRSYGFRALIVMEDHSLLLLQQGEIVWSRDDGLASILDMTTSELPVEKEGVSVAKVEHSLLEWLKGHLLKLKGTLMLATPEEVVAIQGMRLKSSQKNKMTRDHNGFRKLLIVLTRAGKIFALHTGDGRVVWSLLLPAFKKSEACPNPTGLNLYQWQVPHHHALDENPSVLVVGSCGGSEAPGVLSFVDTYTGKELDSLTLGHSIDHIIPLPVTDSTEQRLHLLLDRKGHAFLYPRTPEALKLCQVELPNIYWYLIEADKDIIRGHTLRKTCNFEGADEYCFDTRELWSIVFPSDSEKIVATATRNLNEVVHTQAKVVDHDAMYKYLSKNMIFVATVSPKGAGEIGSATPEESSLVVYLIDTITGRILHRVSHHAAQAPVHAVFSENWVIYHYFNLRAHRYEMSVIEIYDQSRAENKDIWKLILGKHDLSSPISSYSRPEVMVKSQSYYFTHSVKTMAVSSTAKGITSKQILIGTIGDQVLALDKRFLDPRRTPNPTPAEREEGLIPLTDALPIIPQSFVTHSLLVEGLRGIVTIPTKLESTSLVFSYGVDLFFTRIAPSRIYDSLTEDFSYALLLLTIVALIAAIFVTWVMSEKKELNEKWR
ncbi:hypothetical protein C5167_018705 [Papaver somniferum]|uniref:ER membrane protein complex subunit 1 n=1 Tax=Papaver somniferum TaxID=3469 RepID=A0A4Y7IS05_PAPSO|nr:ER membrane protein complex subunit 1-like isoform X1 [Papaver somniferum]RZC50279.1 hypothetical protein C5167_018705 [Papaver somniferum]